MGADYQHDMDVLFDRLAVAAHDDEQIELWVRHFAAQGASADEAFEIVVEAVKKKRGRRDAEAFAGRVRKKLIWYKPGTRE